MLLENYEEKWKPLKGMGIWIVMLVKASEIWLKGRRCFDSITNKVKDTAMCTFLSNVSIITLAVWWKIMALNSIRCSLNVSICERSRDKHSFSDYAPRKDSMRVQICLHGLSTYVLSSCLHAEIIRFSFADIIGHLKYCLLARLKIFLAFWLAHLFFNLDSWQSACIWTSSAIYTAEILR